MLIIVSDHLRFLGEGSGGGIAPKIIHIVFGIQNVRIIRQLPKNPFGSAAHYFSNKSFWGKGEMLKVSKEFPVDVLELYF